MSDNKETKIKSEKKSKIDALKKKKVSDMTLVEARADTQLVQIQTSTGEEKNTSRLKALRKQIARLLTKHNAKK